MERLFIDLPRGLFLVGLVWVVAFVWAGDAVKALTWMGIYVFLAVIGLLNHVSEARR